MFSGTFTTRHNFASASEMRRGKKKKESWRENWRKVIKRTNSQLEDKEARGG